MSAPRQPPNNLKVSGGGPKGTRQSSAELTWVDETMASSGLSLLTSHFSSNRVHSVGDINAFLVCGVHALPLPTSVV